jgi:hypothetical protein
MPPRAGYLYVRRHELPLPPMRHPSPSGVALAALSALTFIQPLQVLAQAQPVPAVVYFSQDWCPLTAERDALKTHFRLTMSGCCIFKAEFVGSDTAEAATVIASVQQHTTSEQSFGVCTGDNSELAQQRREVQETEQASRVEQAKIERRSLPGKLRAIELPLLCMRTGELVRDEFTLPEAPAMGLEALPLVRAELKRRGTGLELARVKARSIRTGDSECHLFAAWGLPISSNYTSASSGTSVQHVYGSSTFVYTERSRITGMQGTR